MREAVRGIYIARQEREFVFMDELCIFVDDDVPYSSVHLVPEQDKCPLSGESDIETPISVIVLAYARHETSD